MPGERLGPRTPGSERGQGNSLPDLTSHFRQCQSKRAALGQRDPDRLNAQAVSGAPDRSGSSPAIVADEVHLHVGPNAPHSTTDAAARRPGDEAIVEPATQVGRRGTREAGRLPPDTSAASVNWLTTSRAAADIGKRQFIAPRRRRTRAQAQQPAAVLSASASVSAGPAQTKASRLAQ